MISRREFLKRTGILVVGSFLSSPLASVWGSDAKVEFFIEHCDYGSKTGMVIRDLKSGKRFGIVIDTGEPSREQISIMADLLIGKMKRVKRCQKKIEKFPKR